MRRHRNLLALILAILLATCLIAAWVTRDTGSGRTASNAAAADGQSSPVDDRLLQTARALASFADTTDERTLAGEAQRLADREVDQAFATALREAAATPPPSSGPLKQLADNIVRFKERVASDQARIQKLTKDVSLRDTAADQLDLAKAQLSLDQEELNEAQQDLARQGGDQHAKLERMLQEHENTQHQAPQTPRLVTAQSATTLSEQIQLWLSLNDRSRQLLAARQQAANMASALGRQRSALDDMLNKKPQSNAGPAADVVSPDEEFEFTGAIIGWLRRLSDQRKTLTELDKRIQETQQLADVYKRWSGVAEIRRRGVVHSVLGSLAWIFAVLLAVVLIDTAIRRAFGRQEDRKRLHQLRVMAGIAVQFVGVLLILLIVFGPPNQMPTIIGLATAGLTLVLKDFIIAFLGWFVLMGRNGIRIGDWVEIKGVSGEVIEIGLLRTVLLETGNWTNTGHPTGRRVAFVNSYAIEGHYFNFSTAGQWLWEELQVTLPNTGDPYEIARQIRETVERETETDANLAEQDWQGVTHQYDLRSFSAKPAVDLRPSATGLDAIVRYITRAPQRYEVKSRLLHSIVDLLHKPVT